MADGALGPQGRKVRCAQCSHTWFADANGAPVEAPAPPPPVPAPGPTRADVERARRAEIRPHDQMRARIQARSQKASQAAATRAWLLAGFFLVAGGYLAITNRELIVQAFPKSASAYAMVGMKVNVYGLDYFNVKAARGFMGPTPILKVKGEVRNTGKRARAAPDVRIELRDKQGKKLFAWQTQIDALIIGPGEEAPFASYLANPPASAYDVSISFVDEPRGESATPSAVEHPPAAATHGAEHPAPAHSEPAPAGHGETSPPSDASHGQQPAHDQAGHHG